MERPGGACTGDLWFSPRAGDVRRLFFAGKRVWDEYSPLFDSKVYVEAEAGETLGEVALAGHPDVLALTDEEEPRIIVLDWKTGSLMRDHRSQLVGYALLAQRVLPVDVRHWPVKVVTAWLQEGVVDVADITEAEAEELYSNIQWAADNPDTYGPSPEACLYCPRSHECPARTALVRQVATDFGTYTHEGELIGPGDLGRLTPRADMLKRVLDQFYAARKAAIAEHGSIPLDGDRELFFSSRTKATISLTPKAESVLAEYSVDPAECTTVAKGKLMAAVGAAAHRGEKGKRKAQIMQELTEAGAVTESEYRVVSVRKTEQEELGLCQNSNDAHSAEQEER